MRTQKPWTIFPLALAVLTGGVSAGAQDKTVKKAETGTPTVQRQEVIITREGPGLPRTPLGPGQVEISPGQKGDTFVFVSTEMGFEGKVVKGAPYSAQAVTETVQTLADGNRIVRKNTATVYRDSEGRTRRDQAIGSIGPFAAAGDPPQTVLINDPVANANYVLDPRTKTARKLPRMNFRFDFKGDKAAAGKEGVTASGQEKSAVRIQRDGESRGFVFTAPLPPPGPDMPPPPPGIGPGVQFVYGGRESKAETKTEKLDRRTVEGVEAEGTRTTTTIPAGEIGNEQPIVITSERWYSPELQTVVMTRHSDPRFGETTYRLTNITREEPAPALFQVPSDYTLRETPPFVRTMRREGQPAAPPEH